MNEAHESSPEGGKSGLTEDPTNATVSEAVRGSKVSTSPATCQDSIVFSDGFSSFHPQELAMYKRIGFNKHKALECSSPALSNLQLSACEHCLLCLQMSHLDWSTFDTAANHHHMLETWHHNAANHIRL